MAKKSNRLSLSGMDAKAIVGLLNSKYGANTVIQASRAVGMRIRFTSSGVYRLDFALGGGFPRNRITEIRGPFSSGKTTVALMSIAKFQQESAKGLAAYIDLERTFDPAYAQSLGCDLDRILLVSPDSGEQSVDIVNDLTDFDEDLWMILDSIAALVPTAEIEGSMDDQFMGLQARLVNRAMRVATARMKSSLYEVDAPTTTLICLNQLREKIGVMFGNPETTPGGKGKDFYYSVMTCFRNPASEKITVDKTVNGIKRKVQVGQCHNFTVNKNKTGASQYEEGSFTYYTKPFRHYKAYDVDNDAALLEFALFHNVLVPKSSTLAGPKGISLSLKKDVALRQIHGDDRIAKILYGAILDAIKKENLAKAADEDEDEDEDENDSPTARPVVKIIRRKK